MEPTFNYYYNMLIEEVDVDRVINWLSEIPREKWTLASDGGRRWGQMTTNLVGSINFKKSINLPIGALVKYTDVRCNALFNKRG